MSHLLPHMYFPIGSKKPNEDHYTLLGMVDLGAGLNLERQGYHKSIYECHPNLVEKFAYLHEVLGMDPFPIRGIGGRDKGHPAAECITIITYKTPFRVDGVPLVVSFGLREGVACNTVFSYLFLSALKDGVMFENMTLISSRLGEIFLHKAKIGRAHV